MRCLTLAIAALGAERLFGGPSPRQVLVTGRGGRRAGAAAAAVAGRAPLLRAAGPCVGATRLGTGSGSVMRFPVTEEYRSPLLFVAGSLALGLSSSLRSEGPRKSLRHRPVQLSATLEKVPTGAVDIIKDQRGNLAELDADAMLAAQAFPFAPADLIAMAKDFICADYGAKDTDVLAEDFEFVGPFVGPLTRQQYLDALGGNLNPSAGFPDLVGRQFGFHCDPVEPGRVWWVSRPAGTFTRPFFGAEPDGRRAETPPQAMGVVFNAYGRVRKINVGAVIDRTSGNTGGLGGLFGFLWFVGKAPPAPEYRPYKRSWQFQLLSKIGPFLTKLQQAKEEKNA